MKYMLLAYENAGDFAARKDPAKQQAYVAGWMAYGKALKDAGILVGGAGLLGSETASTVRRRNGKHEVQDGPYAETKEQLGGYYIIDVADLDMAIEWTARCPAAVAGAVEVRPVMPPLA